MGHGEASGDLFSELHDLDFTRMLLADLHDDLAAKVARFGQLADLSAALGVGRAMIPGGEVAYSAYVEARSSFVHGNFVATVLLCQSFAEQMLAAHLELPLNDESLPARVSFRETMKRCQKAGLIQQNDAHDLERLMKLRNPLSRYQDIDDPTNLSRRAIDAQVPAQEHLRSDASFAIHMALRLIALPTIRLGGNAECM